MQSELSTYFPLENARVHEVCGAGAQGFATILAAQKTGPVLWIREAWRAEGLNPVGMSPFLDPSRLLCAQVKDQAEALAVMEETLRDGAVPTVIAELGQRIDLTAGRRLQLAAKSGQTTGLCLIPENMGSNAAQTRWRSDPVFDPMSDLGSDLGRDPQGGDSTLMRWSLIKNKTGTLSVWYVRCCPYKSNPTDRLVVVPAPVK
jgi:protein ImuA